MGALVQYCYRVYMKNGDTWTEYTNWPDNNNVHSELLSNKTTSKISIQAPPGTIVQIEGKDIVIGRSGIFDFDNEDINISSLLFPEGRDTQVLLVAAQNILGQVKADLTSDIALLNGGNPNYSAFCENLKQQYSSKTYTTQIIQDGETVDFSVTGIAEAIAVFQEAEQGIGSQNSDLKNIIVNYVEND